MEIISKLLDDVMIKYSCYIKEISPDDNFTMFVGQNSGKYTWEDVDKGVAKKFLVFFCDKKTYIYRCRLFSYMSRNVPVRRRSWSPLDLQKINSIEDKRYEKNELTWDERCLEWRRFKRNVKTKFKVSSKFMNCNETLTVSNTKTPS